MYTRRLRGIEKLKSFNIEKEDFVIYGSAPMVLRGLKKKNDDLDILVKDNVWEKLKSEYPNNINGDYIDIDELSFTHTDKDFLGDIDEVMKKTDIVDGFHILSLLQTKEWKEKVGSEKHLNDAKVIDEYLNKLESKF